MKSRRHYQESRLRYGARWRSHINKPDDEPVRTTIETPRLILRPFESGDVEAAFAWFGDPIVMRFTPTGPDASIEQTENRIANYQEHQIAHGFSRWIMLDHRLGRPIGDSGLLKLQEYGRIDLGFRLAQSHWGKGLAAEAASAWVRAAFDDFHIERLTAFVHPRNVASIRVLEKLGFGVPCRGAGHDHGTELNCLLSRAKDLRPVEVRPTCLVSRRFSRRPLGGNVGRRTRVQLESGFCRRSARFGGSFGPVRADHSQIIARTTRRRSWCRAGRCWTGARCGCR